MSIHIQVNENLDTPLRLNAIRITGARTTRPSFLSALFAPYLPILPHASYLTPSAPSPSATTSKKSDLRSLLSTTRELTALLAQFDLFSSVEASLESPESFLAERDEVDIVLKVKEVPRFYLKTATDVGDGEGTAVRSVPLSPSTDFCCGARPGRTDRS